VTEGARRRREDERRPARSENDRLMTVEDLAEYLGLPIATIYKQRSEGTGPPGYRVGKFVRWRRSEVDAWLETKRDPV
jgi:excisionase family DNA binding protein